MWHEMEILAWWDDSRLAVMYCSRCDCGWFSGDTLIFDEAETLHRTHLVEVEAEQILAAFKK